MIDSKRQRAFDVRTLCLRNTRYFRGNRIVKRENPTSTSHIFSGVVFPLGKAQVDVFDVWPKIYA